MKNRHTMSTKSRSLLTLQWIVIQDYGLRSRHYVIYFSVLDFFPFLWISICFLLGTTFSYWYHFSYHFILKIFSCLLLLDIDDLKLIHSWKLSCVFITVEKVANNTYQNTGNIKSLIWIFFLTWDALFRVPKQIVTRLSFAILKELLNCVLCIICAWSLFLKYGFT